VDEDRLYTATGVAELLASHGAIVEIVTSDLNLVPAALRTSHEFHYKVPQLMRLGVTTTIATCVQSIGAHTVTLANVLTHSTEQRSADAVVLATVRRPSTDLGTELDGKVAQLYVVGDALAPRQLFEAFYEGHRFARMVGRTDVPADMSEAPPNWEPI